MEAVKCEAFIQFIHMFIYFAINANNVYIKTCSDNDYDFLDINLQSLSLDLFFLLFLGFAQNGRRKSNIGNGEIDWGDSATGAKNDFLSDLIPHYVTPRHRPLDAIDDDFTDVILGSRKKIK